MNEVIERMVRVVIDKAPLACKYDESAVVEAVRAVIEAIREPTEEMIEAAHDTEHSIEAVADLAPDIDVQLANFWRAMIDKLLEQ